LLLTVKMGKIHHFCNKICCQTSMFINSRRLPSENIVMFRYIPGKCHDIPWYSGIFRDIQAYSVIFRHIPRYSGIPGFHNALLLYVLALMPSYYIWLHMSFVTFIYQSIDKVILVQLTYSCNYIAQEKSSTCCTLTLLYYCKR
jgi:hypothetical protein